MVARYSSHLAKPMHLPQALAVALPHRQFEPPSPTQTGAVVCYLPGRDSLDRSLGQKLARKKHAPSRMRELRFAAGAGRIYSRIKAAQVLMAIRRLEDHRAQERWNAIHLSIGNDLYRLCADLGGFHVKVGQFFSTRPDLVPEQWCRELGRLCDAVEPMSSDEARQVFLEELGLPLIEWIDKPLGSASVAQVHAGRLAPTSGPLRWLRSGRGRAVAIKVRRPDTEHFDRDLKSVRVAASLIQKFELSFDLLSAVDELRDRVAQEIDLRHEFENLRLAGGALRRATRGAVAAPEAIAATERCLVTELIDGSPISALARSDTPAGAPSPLIKIFGRRMFVDLYDAYGRMLLLTPTFHADPHPGNLMVPSRSGRATALAMLRALTPPGLRSLLPFAPPRLYVVDWGQCGGPTPPERRRQLAKLFLALAEGDGSKNHAIAARQATALRELGVSKGGAPDDQVEANIARGMFDSGTELGPMSGEGSLADEGGVQKLPKDLFLVLRVTQMLRGMGAAAEKAGAKPVGSLAVAWRPLAEQALRSNPT